MQNTWYSGHQRSARSTLLTIVINEDVLYMIALFTMTYLAHFCIVRSD